VAGRGGNQCIIGSQCIDDRASAFMM